MAGGALGDGMSLASPPQNDRLSRRVAAAFVLIPLVLGLTWAGGWSFAIMIAGFAGLLGWEWARLCGVLNVGPVGWLLPAGLALLMFVAADNWFLPAAAGGAGLAIALLLLHTKRCGAQRAGWLALGVAAILPAGLALLWLRTEAHGGMALIFWLMLVVWVTDTGAYAVGRSIGGPLLAQRISPSKTWAGLIGGLTAAFLAGGLAAMVLTGKAFYPAATAGLIIGVASGLGDLFESYLKRTFKVKDSGGLIPGHGGVMDRLDSLLAAAPVTAVLYLAGWQWL
jgi:phosphatidate cytidylyltransferase